MPPLDLGYFIIRPPRVSPINAISTMAPSSSGTYVTFPALSIEYVGVSTSAILTLSGTRLLTLIGNNPSHPDNLNITLSGLSISAVTAAINANPNYLANIITSSPTDSCLFLGVTTTNILNTVYTIYYNVEAEFLVDVDAQGDLGTASISWKEGDFTYQGANQKWLMNAGVTYDDVGIVTSIPIDTLLPDGNTVLTSTVPITGGVELQFFPTMSASGFDLNSTVTFTNLVLSSSLGTATAQIAFPAAPILIPDTLQVNIDGVLATENVNYQISYGSVPEMRASFPSPYLVTSGNNILEVRYDNDSIQEFIIPPGDYTAQEVADIVNLTAVDFEAYGYINTTTHQEYFSAIAFRGTTLHQLTIENGSINNTLGYTNFSAIQGSGNGGLLFLTPVAHEDITITTPVNQIQVAAPSLMTTNPFLGVNLNNFNIYEDDVAKTENVDYLVNSNGVVSFITIVNDEPLMSGVLRLDTGLFPPSYTIYDNGTALIEDTDYKINIESGWITLLTSAFANHLYSADYISTANGDVVGEVILGNPATMESANAGPYAIVSGQNALIIAIASFPDQTFNLPLSATLNTDNLVSSINNTASGFIAINSNSFVTLETLQSGPSATIQIKNGSANTVLGFTLNQSAAGSGAKGGEQSLELAHAPISIIGFTAPAGGNTIVIKNNDVSARYPKDAIISMLTDYYQISQTTLDPIANIVGSNIGPYTIIQGTNDTLIFYVDGGPAVTVVLTAGVSQSIQSIVVQINAVDPGIAEAFSINGMQLVKLKSGVSIAVGNGNANRTFGFNAGDMDTNTPDSVITITTSFKTTYVNPDLYTTAIPVLLTAEINNNVETPQNTNTLIIVGDVTEIYIKNCLVQIDNRNFYSVLSTNFDGTNTTITFGSKVNYPVYPTTPVAYTPHPILVAGTTALNTDLPPILSQGYTLMNNNVIIPTQNFKIAQSGAITLNTGLGSGDLYTISYTGKRIIQPSESIYAAYTYYNYLPKGSNITIYFQATNPDNFYVNVLHASTFLNSFTATVSAMSSTSSSTGFPTGAIPPASNATSGNGSYYYDLGDAIDNVTMCENWYSFFDNRINYFESELNLLSGYIVGAEDGTLTLAQIETSQNLPPTRLFPFPDSRPIAEQSNPLEIPALLGFNQNDAGSDAEGYGPTPTAIFTSLTNELPNLYAEISNLTSLLTKSATGVTLSSTGSFVIVSGGETLTFYIETDSLGSLVQSNVTVMFAQGAQTASYIAGQINAACAFLGVSPASVVGSDVVLTVSNATPSKRIYITSDAPDVGFGLYNQACLRSRDPLWTYEYPYPTLIPSHGVTDSVYLDILGEGIQESLQLIQNNLQLSYLNGEMQEWLPPFVNSFIMCNSEFNACSDWISNTTSFSASSSGFNALHGTELFTALDDDTVVNNRIALISDRITAIMARSTDLANRITAISDILTAESLYAQRYSWLILLTNREYGFLAVLNRVISQQVKKLAQTTNNTAALSNVNSFS